MHPTSEGDAGPGEKPRLSPAPSGADGAARIAHFLTHRTRLLHITVAVLVVACGLTIAFGVRFASDVLDMLPQSFESVKVYKIFDREFSQAQQLTFAITDETKECDLDGFVEHFGEELRKEPWVIRVMEHSPMSSPDGMGEVQKIALPMVFNQSPEDFGKALTALQPERITSHFARLKAELEAGSPKAQAQLEFDPLGILAPAMKGLGASFTTEQTNPFVSQDGTLHVVFAITRQEALGAHACQATMKEVEDFNRRVLASWDGPKPQIGVTGRTPYVAELSEMMHSDVIGTLGTSVVLVSLVFWFGYRRIRPLLAIMHVLMLCCVVAVALGALVFHELNMITIGLCSILIGLGVDFGMMLYSIYEAGRGQGQNHEEAIAGAIRSQGRSIIFGAITSAAAFLSLTQSGCIGFSQLGVLIALGIVSAGLFMLVTFFGFIGKKFVPRKSDPLRTAGERFVAWVFANPKSIFLCSASVLVALAAFAFLPIWQLRFDANPRSLEPRNSHAGNTLRLIMEKMPAIGEPWIALVQATDRQEMHDRLEKLQKRWTELVDEGKLKSASSPAAYYPSPRYVEANIARLDPSALAESRKSLDAAIEREGMSREGLASAYTVLDGLDAVAAGDRKVLDWRQVLPQESSLRFVFDRFYGRDPLVTVGYVTPEKKGMVEKQIKELVGEMDQSGVKIHYSGWSYTLAELVPWSKSKLVELSVLMLSLNIVLLIFIYRRFYPLFVLILSLGFSMAAMWSCLKLLAQLVPVINSAAVHLVGRDIMPEISLNLFNVLAFPLVIGVGVDYGIYLVIAMRAKGDVQKSTALIFKPVLLSGLTTAVGFGSLAVAQSPALQGLGIVCGMGVACCLFSTFFFILPLYAWRGAH